MFFTKLGQEDINKKPKCVILNLRSMQIEMSEQEWGSLKSEYLMFMCPSGLRVCRYKKGAIKTKNVESK